ncbi:MAG: sodium/proline symporter [Bacteroidia bacterium]
MALATWILIGLYMLVVLYFVVRGARRTRSIEDYAAGSVTFSPVAVGLSLAASMTSAATFIINPGFAALYGLPAVLSFVVVLPAAALVSLYVFTKGFRSYGMSIRALTMAQWIGTRYGSRGFALFFAFLSLLLLTFIVLICTGITKVLATALGAPEVYVLAGTIVFIFGYMMFGGANSMVYTNMAQALLMIVVAMILLGSGYDYFAEGIGGFLARLRAVDPQLVAATYLGSPLFRDFFEIVFCQAVIGVAIVCQPHIITKSLLLKNDRDVNRYLLTGIVVEVLFFAVVFAGLYARLTFPALSSGDQPLAMDGIMPAYVVARFPVYVGLIVVLGLISAGISTLEGLIQSISTSITSDILDPLLGRRLFAGDSGRKIQANRLVIALLAVLAFIFSYQQLIAPDLSVAIFAQNGVYAYFSAAFVPVLFGTFRRDTPLVVPVSGALVALVVHFAVYYGRLTPYMALPTRNPAIASALAIVAAVVVAAAVYLLRPRAVS